MHQFLQAIKPLVKNGKEEAGSVGVSTTLFIIKGNLNKRMAPKPRKELRRKATGQAIPKLGQTS